MEEEATWLRPYPSHFATIWGNEPRWAEQPEGGWRVIERHYREGTFSAYIRYRLRRVNDTEDGMADEPDLDPWVEEPHV